MGEDLADSAHIDLFFSEHGRRYFETLMGRSHQSVGWNHGDEYPADMALIIDSGLSWLDGLEDT